MSNHELTMREWGTKDLHLIECGDCKYAFIARVNSLGVIDMKSREMLNHGDLEATHMIFNLPPTDLKLTGGVGVTYDNG